MGISAEERRRRQRERARRLYQDDPEFRQKRLESNRRWRAKIDAEIAKLKQGPCVDCGQTYPAAAMDLHHRDPATKLFGLAKWAKAKPPKGVSRLEYVLQEAAKCDLICANCHRIRHS